MSNGTRNQLNLTSKILSFLGIVMLATGFLVTTINQPVSAANEMVTLCHAAGQDGTLQFVTLTISWQAAYGPAGHFNEDGTTRAGHENDYLGPCITQATATNTPANTATNTPTSIPTNTATNTPTNTPTDPPTNTPTNTPTDPPTNTPTNTPTDPPTNTPTNTPTDPPINTPTNTPTDPPINDPTATPVDTATATNTPIPTDPPQPTATTVPTDPPVLNTVPAPAATAEVLIPVTGADLNAFNSTRTGRTLMNFGSLLLGLGLVLNGISRKQ
ncbi:MAG: hypothetical protein AAGU17_06345 [Anaerolineaceae bacterium]